MGVLEKEDISVNILYSLQGCLTTRLLCLNLPLGDSLQELWLPPTVQILISVSKLVSKLAKKKKKSKQNQKESLSVKITFKIFFVFVFSRNVSKEHEGSYHCEASNQKETIRSQPAFLLPAGIVNSELFNSSK